MAMTTLILGIVAVLISFFPFINIFAFVLGGVAVILGIVAIVKGKANGRVPGMSIVGMILGAIAVVIAILVMTVFSLSVGG